MWYNWTIGSKIDEIKEVAKTIKRQWDGIREFIKSKISSGIVEGINSKIKTALKQAYGFKNFQYYRTIIYLIVGKLEFSFTHTELKRTVTRDTIFTGKRRNFLSSPNPFNNFKFGFCIINLIWREHHPLMEIILHESFDVKPNCQINYVTTNPFS